MTGATNGGRTAYPFGAPGFTPVFGGVHVTRFLVLCVCFVDRCLSFCTFFFLAILLSVLFQYTDSDYLYGILKLFLANCCLLVIAVKCFCTVLM
jgi:hypothetical protein